MNKQQVIIVGSSGHAKVVIDIFEKEGRFEIVGLLDYQRKKGEETLGYKILGSEENLREIITEYPDAKVFVAVGDNWKRNFVVNKVLGTVPNIGFATAIHPSAQIGKNVTIGKGTSVMAAAVINSDTQIGDFTIVNTGACIDHDSKMGDYSSLAPGVVTGGSVSVGAFSAISIGTVIIHGMKIGKHSVIGAGSLLNKNCDDYSVMYGVPAKFIRNRKEGESYL